MDIWNIEDKKDDYLERINYFYHTNTLLIHLKKKTPKTLEDLFLFLNKKVGYCLSYLNIEIGSNNNSLSEKKEDIEEYLNIIFKYFFIWNLKKETEEIIFFLDKKNTKTIEITKNITNQNQKNSESLININFCVKKGELGKWKKPIAVLKKVINRIRLNGNVNISAHICETINCFYDEKKTETKTILITSGNFFLLSEKEKKLFLMQKFEKEKIYELGVFTRFSTLDGISSATDYVKEAIEKNYRSLAITDHYNVQSFPEFSDIEEKEIKKIYGCELEMIENKKTSFFINFSQEDKKKKIDELTYFFFDTETTGLFSNYNEIIEIGFVVFNDKKIIDEGSFLIKPEKKLNEKELKNWFHSSINYEQLLKNPRIDTVIKEIKNRWANCILVAHNAIAFDFPFLNKAWYNVFNKTLDKPIIDTLVLCKLIFPGKKSYSLQKLSNYHQKEKIVQEHRALSDAKLLLELFKKIINKLEELGIYTWEEVEQKINSTHTERGKKVKVLVKNEEGLYNLYRLITISHTEKFFKNPCVSKEDIEKHRNGLLIGASSNRQGELFSYFSSFNPKKEIEEKIISFYDYIEIGSPYSLSYLWESGQLRKEEIEKIWINIILLAKKKEKPFIANHNIHYCKKKDRILKNIIIANEAINNSRHYLYKEATGEEKEDCFDNLPYQHLLTKEEMIEQWIFLGCPKLIEEILFRNQEKIIKKIEKTDITPPVVDYSSEDGEKKKDELESIFTAKANLLFGKVWPNFIKERIEKEWKIIKEKYVFIFWIALKIAEKAKKERMIVGSRGSVGCSFIAFLCGITELNPISSYKYCHNCLFVEELKNAEFGFLSYDYETKKETCPRCRNYYITVEGLNMPLETFFGMSGEKTPDIDLNFSGDCQKIMHNFIRELLGKENTHRIGTVNTIKKSVSEIFWNTYISLRKSLTSKENISRLLENTPSWLLKYKQHLIKQKEFCEEDVFNLWIKEEEKDQSCEEREFFKIRKKILQKLEGIKRTTGQHPGGILITPPNIDIHRYTPLNYPADKKSEFTTTHLEYNFLSRFLLKMDILGHDEPKVFESLFSLTGIDPLSIAFNDKNVMKIFTEADTLGVTEFGTDLAKKILSFLKPTKFSQLVQICGFSHGTDVWINNQQNIYKKKILKLDQLIGCRDDIWNILKKKGLNTQEAFIITEFIRKGKWKKIPEELKKLINQKLSDDEGKAYIGVLEKIVYIIPKAHAIAYTMSAWRGAYYKLYYPKQFYSILLTHHITTYDICLMTLNTEIIKFRLESLVENISKYKNSLRELISSIKVLKKINENALKTEELIKNILDRLKKNNIELSFAKNRKDFFLTSKEKDLLFSLKVFAEMNKKNLVFEKGIDLNYSDADLFKINENKILFPLSSIYGFGEMAIKKIISFRQSEYIEKEKWKKKLSELLNINHIQQLINLDKCNMLIWKEEKKSYYQTTFEKTKYLN